MSVNTSVLFNKDYLTTDKPLFTDEKFNSIYGLRAVFTRNLIISALGFYFIRKKIMKSDLKLLQSEFSRNVLPLIPGLLLLNNY